MCPDTMVLCSWGTPDPLGFVCSMRQPILGSVRGWELGLLFCFFLWWKLLTVPSVAPANPLSAFSATLLPCLSRFLFFNFLH